MRMSAKQVLNVFSVFIGKALSKFRVSSKDSRTQLVN